MCTAYVTSACRSQKRALDSLDLESWVVVSHMWMLGIKPRPSAKAAAALNCRTSLEPPTICFLTCYGTVGFCCRCGDWSQDLIHVMSMFYHWATSQPIVTACFITQNKLPSQWMFSEFLRRMCSLLLDKADEICQLYQVDWWPPPPPPPPFLQYSAF